MKFLSNMVSAAPVGSASISRGEDHQGGKPPLIIEAVVGSAFRSGRAR